MNPVCAFYLGQIGDERAKQDEKWGVRDQSDEKWLPILMEELGEVARCMLEGNTHSHLRDELVQVAAVAVAWLECKDRKHAKTVGRRPRETSHEF